MLRRRACAAVFAASFGLTSSGCSVGGETREAMVVATNATAGVAAGGGWVYWTTLGSVSRRRAEGGPVEVAFAASLYGDHPLLADDRFVYSITETQIRRIDHERLSIETVARSDGNYAKLRAMALDATHVYWTEAADDGHGYGGTIGTVFRAPKDGSEPASVVLSSVQDVGAMAVDDTSVCLVVREGLVRIPKGGGVSKAIVSGTPGRVVGGGDACWFSHLPTTDDWSGSDVFRAGADGVVTTIATRSGRGPVVDTLAYSVNDIMIGGGDDQIYAVPKHGEGSPVQLFEAPGEDRVVDIAAWNDRVFWVDGRGVVYGGVR